MNSFLLKVTLLTFFFVSLNGCALTPKEKMSTYPDVGKLVYISLIGDSFELSVTGTTIFNNDSGLLNVGDWNIDSTIQEAVIESSKGDKFNFQTLEFIEPSIKSSITREISEPDILMSEAKKQGADFLVVFAPKYQGYIHQGDLFNRYWFERGFF